MRCHQRLVLSLPFLFLLACGGSEPPEEQPGADASTEPAEATVAPDGHSSRIALDWAGSYSGVLPCASCPGIETVVTLNEDGTFERSMLYIDESPVPETDGGTFTWNDAGSTVVLGTADAEPQHYQVGENVLFHLDREGQRVTGDLAAKYMLHKHLRDPEIEGRRWKLVELGGNPVEAGQAERRAVLELHADDAIAAGNTSCNSFSGPYAIKAGQRISFGPNMAVTRMACPDSSLESAFLEMLQQVDHYTVSDEGMLSLNRARIAPLARFEPGR